MILVELTEWDKVDQSSNRALGDRSVIDAVLNSPITDSIRDRIGISHRGVGLEIASSSYVGRVDIGPLRIAIRPKLPMMPLARLLRYAYGLRDLETIEETSSPLVVAGLHDLIIGMLIREVEELLQRGPVRQYVPLSNKLDSPRGRILTEQLVRQGGLKEARLPCRYFERHTNWPLNQVVIAGLNLAAQMAEDRDMRRHLFRLAGEFGDVYPLKLSYAILGRTERSLNRLTVAYTSAIAIIRLLYDMLGLEFEGDEHRQPIPGFLFDMNMFFQKLISRFFHEHLHGLRVVDERAIRTIFSYDPNANPRRRVAPKPRPDFALFSGNSLKGFLDAKYRDVWSVGSPADWLYQLSIYSLASPAGVSVLLYASMADQAKDEQINVRAPLDHEVNRGSSVIFRPVPLMRMSKLLERRAGIRIAAERTQLATALVALHAGQHRELGASTA